MKKLSLILKFHFILLFSYVVIYSCCSEPTIVTIVGDGEMSFVTSQSTQALTTSDTLTGGTLSILANFELMYVENYDDLNLINVAYGTSCPEEFQNPIERSSIVFTCNNDIQIDQTVFKAGDNLNTISDLTVFSGEGSVEIFFNENLMSRTVFTNGPNTFTVSVQTSDGLDFESNGDLFINI